MRNPEQKLRLGAVQAAEVLFDRERTLQKDLEYIREAGKKDIDLLVFPEYHLSGPDHWLFKGGDIDIGKSLTDVDEYYRAMYESAITVPGETTDRLGEAAAQAGTTVVVGAIERHPDETGTMYNSQIFIDSDGSLLGVRRKIVPTLSGKIFYKGGDGESIRTFETTAGTVGGLICGEHTNPLAVYATLALGEEVHAASWPALPWREPVETRYGLRTRYHAFVGKVPAVLASGVVTEQLAETIDKPEWEGAGGASAIVAPDGTYAAGPKTDGAEGIVYADVAQSRSGKVTHDILGHYNRFDIFDLSVDRSANPRLSVQTENDRYSTEESAPKQDRIKFTDS